MVRRCAPSATRTPISRVRWLAEYGNNTVESDDAEDKCESGETSYKPCGRSMKVGRLRTVNAADPCGLPNGANVREGKILVG